MVFQLGTIEEGTCVQIGEEPTNLGAGPSLLPLPLLANLKQWRWESCSQPNVSIRGPGAPRLREKPDWTADV